MQRLGKAFGIIALYLCSMLLVVSPVQAQVSPFAAVSITCAPASLDIAVNPGSTYTAFTTCTVTNPTAWTEKVEIQVQASGLTPGYPGSIYIGSGAETDVQIVLRAQPYMPMVSLQVSVTGTVTELNSAPPPNTATSTSSLIANVQQYSLIQVEAVEPFVQLLPKTDKIFEFKVYNLGNQIDFIKVGITDNSRQQLDNAGFTTNLPTVKPQIENTPTGQNVRVMIRTPKEQGWADDYYTLDFYAESEFACANGACNRESQMITIYVRGFYLPGFEMIPTVSMLALAAAIAGRNMIRNDDEEEEGVPQIFDSAPGL